MNHTDPTVETARIRQMADYWEQQLPEVIRTPAVVSALRAALEPAAAAAAQPKSRTTIVEGPQTVSHNANEPAASAGVAPPTNRAEGGSGRAAEAELYVLLRKAGEDRYEAQALIDRHRDEVLRRAELRRLAVEAHGTGTQQQVPQRAYPDCERCGDTGVDPERDGAEPCPECQQTNVPAPAETDEERADREATEHDHARGDHTYCGITCETEMPTEHLRNFVIAKGYPGTGGALDELLRRARTEVAEQQAAAEAEQDDTMHACPGRWGGPDCRCFDAEPAPGEQQAAAADGEETLCRCGHGRAYHDAKYADPQCRLCPEDGERSWRHPFTPAEVPRP